MSVERSAVIVMVAIGLASLLLLYAIGAARVTRKEEPRAAFQSPGGDAAASSGGAAGAGAAGGGAAGAAGVPVGLAAVVEVALERVPDWCGWRRGLQVVRTEEEASRPRGGA